MAYTQADIDELKAAIVARKGASETSFADRSVKYASIEEMMNLLSVMQGEVNGGGSRTRYAATSKGV